MALAALAILASLWSGYAAAQQSLELSAIGELASGQAAELTEFGLRPDQVETFQRLVAAAEGKVEAVFDRSVSIPTFVRAENIIPTEGVGPEERAYSYFETYKGLYRMTDPRAELRLMGRNEDDLRHHHLRYQQLYQGIEVVGAELVAHLRPEGGVWFVQGKYIPGIRASTRPTVPSSALDQIVRTDFARRRGDVPFGMRKSELGILNPWIYDPSFESVNRLVWIAVLREERTGRQWTYHVDAEDGKILEILDSARTIDSEIWDRRNTSASADDRLWYVDDTLQNVTGATVHNQITNLNRFVSYYWNYLPSRFKVYSIDSASTADGKQLVAYGFYVGSLACPNACWDCLDDKAVFCQNMVERDIVAHELTHGLVEHSGGNLAYRNQSGALNESFADVFSEFVDCAAGACDWLHGTSRDLGNPLNRGQQPDHVGATGQTPTDHPLYVQPCNPLTNPCSLNNDWGGVHTNGGVPNIVAYHIVNGTPNDHHYNYSIKGIGLKKSEQLYYRTLISARLPTTANFNDARQSMLAVCEDFVTKKLHKFEANDCCQVNNAWASVGVGDGCSAMHGNITSFACTKDKTPCFITADATMSAGHTLRIDPDTEVYVFPNVRLKALGLVDADGGTGSISVRRSGSAKGLEVSGRLRLTNGGELVLPEHTFQSTDTRPHAITLADGVETSSFIYINKGFSINDVNVRMNISHSHASDLVVSLRSPMGTEIVLAANVGAAGQNFASTTFDDEAATSVNAAAAPFSGSFRPQNNLNAFDGQNAQGYWRLRINDGSVASTGAMNAWSLDFDF